MVDHAVSDHPAVQKQLDRLSRLSPGADILGLERITELLARLDNPHRTMPPVFHVAGTNGKGSTCAFLRAALEADGKSVHVFTSPHLVRFNERIRIAGQLISDDLLAEYLSRVLDITDDVHASFFEVTTAAAFLAFAEHSADACIIEVGLGGRLDATNVIENPVVCGIAQLGLDHQSFLGTTLAQIAAEKAGIAKSGAPLITQRYPDILTNVITKSADAVGTFWSPMGQTWDAAVYNERLHYRDEFGSTDTPLPRLPGAHQVQNLALAIAMLRHQNRLSINEAALKAAPIWAHWPARLQHLDHGPLLNALESDAEIWLDGGHNGDAGQAIGKFFNENRLGQQKLHLVIGMLANKDVAAYLAPLREKIDHIYSLPIPGHEHHEHARFADIAANWNIESSSHSDPKDAISAIAGKKIENAKILIAGSLYMAGEILRLNDQIPD